MLEQPGPEPPTQVNRKLGGAASTRSFIATTVSVWHLFCCVQIRDTENSSKFCATVIMQVVSVAKWHGSQIAEVAQGIGQHVWVLLKDLASSSQAITLAQVCLLPPY